MGRSPATCAIRHACASSTLFREEQPRLQLPQEQLLLLSEHSHNLLFYDNCLIIPEQVVQLVPAMRSDGNPLFL